MTKEKQDQYNYLKYESLLNSPIRLAVMSLLAGCGEAEFTLIREKTGATDGNLSRHLTKLEENGLIEVTKKFEGKKPVTCQKLTKAGREALHDYVSKLETLIVSMKNKGAE